MNSMKRQKDRTLKDELPRSVGAQYATGDQWRNNSRKNEVMESKQKEYLAVDKNIRMRKGNMFKQKKKSVKKEQSTAHQLQMITPFLFLIF